MVALNTILARFERKLRSLKIAKKLTAEAPAAFKEFADQVNRRTGADRRRTARAGDDRRQRQLPY